MNSEEKKQKQKEYYQKNKEKIKERSKQRHIKNREAILEKAKEYNKKAYDKNREKAIEYSKNYYQNNKEKKIDYQLNYDKNNADKIRERKKQYYLNNVDYFKMKFKSNNLKRKFGIGDEEYIELLNSQNGCCAICGLHFNTLDKYLAVDHDHVTNKIRGLLCSNCNLGLGLFKDNVESLKMAIKYLKKFNDE